MNALSHILIAFNHSHSGTGTVAEVVGLDETVVWVTERIWQPTTRKTGSDLNIWYESMCNCE